MSAPRYARLAARVFVRDGRSEGPPPSPDARARAIDALAVALAARAQRRRLVRGIAACVAAAAMVAAAVGITSHVLRRDAPALAASNSPPGSARGVQIVAHPLGNGASVVVSGAPAPLDDGRQLGEGSRLVTPPAGRATLAFSTGTSVTLAEATDLTVAAEGPMQRLRLSSGSVSLHVAKLGPGQRFLVDTADAEVEVRGTRFDVSLAKPDPSCGGGTPTRVAVAEGVVSVRHAGVEARVAAGEQWPAGCGSSAQTSSAPGNVKLVAPRAAAVSSTLAEQNDLFQEGMAAKREGNTRAAIAAFDRLLSKYPAGPLAENASAERMRVLRTTAPSRAVAAARQYMAAYPNGFAHGEAEAVVAGSP